MAYSLYDDDDDEYNNFWPAPTSDQNQHHGQDATQHFPANVTLLADPFAFASAPTSNNVTYQRGGHDQNKISTQSSLLAGLADLQRQTAQLSLLMNRLPEHLRTPAPPAVQKSHPATVRTYMSSGPPDILNNEHFPQPTPMVRAEVPFIPLSPIRSNASLGSTSFLQISPPTPATRRGATSSSSHVTTPVTGQHLHWAKHAAVDRIPYTRAYLPRNLPIRVSFLRRFQHVK
jgi:hypothetical protein